MYSFTWQHLQCHSVSFWVLHSSITGRWGRFGPVMCSALPEFQVQWYVKLWMPQVNTSVWGRLIIGAQRKCIWGPPDVQGVTRHTCEVCNSADRKQNEGSSFFNQYLLHLLEELMKHLIFGGEKPHVLHILIFENRFFWTVRFKEPVH